jgi:hypothetical protein
VGRQGECYQGSDISDQEPVHRRLARIATLRSFAALRMTMGEKLNSRTNFGTQTEICATSRVVALKDTVRSQEFEFADRLGSPYKI